MRKLTAYTLTFKDYLNGELSFESTELTNKVSFNKADLLEELHRVAHLAHKEGRGVIAMNEAGKCTAEALQVWSKHRDLRRVFVITEHSLEIN